jgi:ChaB
MPKSRRYPITELPGTLQRSCREAQETFLSALDDAVRAHGAGDHAHRIAYLALKQKFEKRGDHWIAKDNPADCGGGGGGKSSGQQIQRALAGEARPLRAPVLQAVRQHSLEAQRAGRRRRPWRTLGGITVPAAPALTAGPREHGASGTEPAQRGGDSRPSRKPLERIAIGSRIMVSQLPRDYSLPELRQSWCSSLAFAAIRGG